jgi:hypothetical protein
MSRHALEERLWGLRDCITSNVAKLLICTMAGI